MNFELQLTFPMTVFIMMPVTVTILYFGMPGRRSMRMEEPRRLDWSLLLWGVVLVFFAWDAHGLIGYWSSGFLQFVSFCALVVFLVLAYRCLFLAWERAFVRFPPAETGNPAPLNGDGIVSLVICLGVGGAYYCISAQFEAYYAAERAASDMREARREWTAGRGVAEVEVGSAIGWLAVDPDIYIDWSYEQKLERGNGAAREIPVLVVLLNNSFADVSFNTAGGVGGNQKLWRVWVSSYGSDEALREWEQPAARRANTSLYPAERMDYVIDWDGRDAQGELVGPGTYEMHLETAAVEPEGEPILASVRIRLEDAGPEVVIEKDPKVEYLKRTIEYQKTSDMMRRSMQQTEEFQRQMRRSMENRR